MIKNTQKYTDAKNGVSEYYKAFSNESRLLLKCLSATCATIFLFISILYASAVLRIPEETNKSRDWIEHTDQILLQTQSLLSALTDVETGQRGYLLTHDRNYLAPFESGRIQSRKLIDSVSHLTADNPLQQARVAELSTLVERKIAETSDTIALAEQGNPDGALQRVRSNGGQQIMDGIRRVVAAMIEEENRLVGIRRIEAQRADSAMETFLFGSGIGLLAMLVIVLGIWGYSLKRTTEISRANEERQQRLLAVLDMATAHIRDRDGAIRFWSTGCRDLYGYDATEAVGRCSHDLLATVFPLPQAEIEALLESDGTWRGELRQRTKSGREVLVATHWTLLRATADQPDVVMETDVDVTEMRRRTAELRSANQELDAFAYAVAHDLRAPLRAMRGFSQALIEDYGEKFEDEAKLYLGQIDQAGRHMGELVDGMLALSRSVRGEMSPEDIDLSALARRIAVEISQAEPSRQVDWQIQPDLKAWGAPDMIELVVRNLLENAWKYTSRTPKPEIRFFAERQADTLFFCVSDNGAGFDMAHSDRLFKPFQRLHRQDEFPGTGIGLAAAQRIVKRHGGMIDARAAPGKGATFRFSLQLSSGTEVHP
nr:CHASE3 domain-containing protein [Telmatospirillum siberiense]